MSSRHRNFPRWVAMSGIALGVAACQPGEFLTDLTGQTGPQAASETEAVPQTVKMIETDVEAPEVYDRTDRALWDGRPSLGGVWVAADDVSDPERVLIRNTQTGDFVIGALFKRERMNPGPPLQLSSDAAAALTILAGAPTEVSVIALRREQVPDPSTLPAPVAEPAGEMSVEIADAGPAPGSGADGVTPLEEASPQVAPLDEIRAEPLDDTIAAAAAALDRSEAQIAAAVAANARSPSTASRTPEANSAGATSSRPAPRQATSRLDKPFLQVGIFSIEENARNTATALRGAGIVPTVLEQESAGKTFWRVVVGPAATSSGRAATLRTIRGLGFEDAYAVTN